MSWAPYSYSKLSTYKQCPRKFRYQYILKAIPFKPSLALERGDFAHSVIEHILCDKLKSLKPQNYTIFNDHNEVYAAVLKNKAYLKSLKESGDKFYVENWMNLDRNLNPTMNRNDKFFTGKIDYYSLRDKTGKNIDWKTGGKSIENINKYKKDYDQLELYGIWMIQKYDLDEVLSEFYYIDLQHKIELTVTREDVPRIKKNIHNQIEKIEADKTFEMKDSPLCGYCEYKEMCFNGEDGDEKL